MKLSGRHAAERAHPAGARRVFTNAFLIETMVFDPKATISDNKSTIMQFEHACEPLANCCHVGIVRGQASGARCCARKGSQLIAHKVCKKVHLTAFIHCDTNPVGTMTMTKTMKSLPLSLSV